MISVSPSDASISGSTSDRHSELASDFDLDPIEEMGEGGVLELEAPLKIAEITVEVSRI